MESTVLLTDGFVRSQFSTPSKEARNPTVQILDLSFRAGGPAFFNLSDGVHIIRGMINKLNPKLELFTSEKIKNFALVRLTSYMTNELPKKDETKMKVVVVLDMELVYPEAHKVGDPLPVTEQASPKVTPQKIEFCSPKVVEPTKPRSPELDPSTPRKPSSSLTTPTPPSLQRKPSQLKPAETKRPPSPSAFDELLFSSNITSRSPLPESPYRTNKSSKAEPPTPSPQKPLQTSETKLPRILAGHTEEKPAEETEFESSSIQTSTISQLNPNQSRWMIQARVTYKSEIISWSQKRKQGNMFWVELLDTSGEIKATIWNDVPRLYSIFEVGKIYYISRAKINAKKGTWNSMQTEHEMELTNTSVVKVCPASHAAAIPNFILNNCQVSNIVKLVAGDRVDLIGVASYGDALTQVISKKDQTTLFKRDVAITDQTGTVRLTLWGDIAQNWVEIYPTVVLIKNAVVAEFKGHSLVFGKRSRVELNPQSEQTDELLDWYAGQTVEEIQNLPFISWKPNPEVQEEQINLDVPV